MLNKIKKLFSDDTIGGLLFLTSFIFIGIMFWACFKPAIWGDEAFSLFLIQKSYLDIVNVTAVDVHPPLYYFILKFFVSLFQICNLTPNLVITIARFVSVVPFVLLLVLSFFKVREYWGWLCCGVFSLCLTSMPQLMYYSVEVRMYSWALFFVTVCFIYAYSIICKSNLKNWLIFVVCGVLAAYTHYFAAVSVIFIFLLLLFYFILNNTSEIKKWVISVIVSLLLYFNWLFVLFGQIMAVNKNYWIEPINLSNIFNYLAFLFLPSFSSSSTFSMTNPVMILLGFLLLESYIIILFYFIKNNHDFYKNFSVMGLFTLILTVFFGIIVSVLIKPVFVNRYMIPSLGIFWLTFAFLLSESWNYKKIGGPVLIIMLLVSCMSSLTFINSQNVEYDVYNDLDSFLSQDFSDNTVFYIDLNSEGNAHYYQIIQYPLNSYHNLNLGTPSSDNIFPTFKDFNELRNDLKNNKTVWLFSSKGYDTILKNCTENNLTIKKQDSYKFELNNTCDLYKIVHDSN